MNLNPLLPLLRNSLSDWRNCSQLKKLSFDFFVTMQVLSVLDLSCHDSQVKLEKVLHRLKWNDFPGLQALLLKVIKSSKICFIFSFKFVSLQLSPVKCSS